MSTRHSRESYRFGPYRVDLRTGLVWKGGAPVPLTPKASELLLLLVQHGEQGITKAELIERLWPDTVVLENNLTVTMSALRKALGESAANPRYIQTLPRRGYRFVRSAAEPEESALEPPPPSEGRPRPRLGAAAEEALAQSAARCAQLFVGRTAELAFIQRQWQAALSGSGRVLCVSGEPGIGKTTLIERFIATLGARPALLVARGRCLETFGSGEAYWPFLELLDVLLCGPESERVQTALRTCAPTWYAQFPGVIAADEAAQLSRETLGATQQRKLRELADAFVALARERPLLLVLEDLHWADPSSIDLLRALCHKVRGLPWLIFATFRAADAAHNTPLAAFRRELVPRECAELALAPLGEAQVRSYVGARFTAGALPGELSRFLLERTEGHPLFLTRLVSLLVERGDISERAGVWELCRPLSELWDSVPPDVASLLAGQLERLSAEERRALTYASVEGEEFSSTVLAALLEEDELSLQERMAELEQSCHLIRTLGEERWPDGHVCVRYRFAHALYQTVLYDKIVSARRARLHLRAAEVLVRHFGEGAPLLAVTLARHFEIGGDVERAIRYLSVAAARAHQLLAHREAREHFSRAIALVSRLPSAAQASAAPALHLGRGWVDFDARGGDFGRADFDAACRHAEASGDPALWCKALFAASALAYFEFRLEDSRALDERLLRVARASGRSELISLALVSLGGGYVVEGKLDEAMRMHQDAWAGAEQASDPNLLAMLHFDRGRCRRLRSDYAGALAAFESSLSLWLGVSGVMAISNYQEIARAHANLGHFSAALRTYEKAAELARLNGQEHRLREQPSRVGWILRELGDVRGASAEDERALAAARAQGALLSELSHSIDLALDHLDAGQVAPAEQQMNAVARRLESGPIAAFPIDLLGIRLRRLEAECRLQRARGELRAARQNAEELLARASRMPWPKYVASARAELGRVARAQGEAALARSELRGALQVFAAHPVPSSAWRVQAELASLELCAGDAAAARAAFAAARNGVEQIASGVTNAQQRETFWGSPAVRAVLEGARLTAQIPAQRSVPAASAPRSPATAEHQPAERKRARLNISS